MVTVVFTILCYTSLNIMKVLRGKNEKNIFLYYDFNSSPTQFFLLNKAKKSLLNS